MLAAIGCSSEPQAARPQPEATPSAATPPAATAEATGTKTGPPKEVVAEPMTPAKDTPSAQRLAAANALTKAAWESAAQGRVPEALKQAQQALPIKEEALGTTHEETFGLRELCAMLHEDLDDFAAAQAVRDEVLRLRTDSLPPGHWRIHDAQLAVDDLRRRTKLSAAERASLRQASGVVLTASQTSQPQQLTEAIAATQKAAAVQEQILGATHHELAMSLLTLGDLLSMNGQFAEAQQSYERALDIRRKVLGDANPATGLVLNSLGLLCNTLGQYAEAKTYFEQALKVAAAAYGDQAPATAIAQNNLGSVLKTLGDLKAAREHFEQALTINLAALGENHPATANTLTNLGMLLEQVPDLPQARKYHERALAICRQLHPAPHPDTAQVLNNLATVASAQGDYPRARASYEEALQILEQTAGPQHLDTAQVRRNFGAFQYLAGDFAAARKNLEQALDVFTTTLGKDHPAVAEARNNLGRLLTEMGLFERAQTELEQALAIFQAGGEQAEQRLPAVLHNLGYLHLQRGQYPAARQRLEESLAIRRKVFGERHPEVAAALNALGQLDSLTGDLDQSISHSEQALGILAEAVGRQHPDVAKTLNNLAVAKQRRGDYGDALRCYEEAAEILEAILGRQHPDTATAINNLADWHRSQGDYSQARPLYSEALAIRRQVFGDQHVDTAASWNNLGLLLQETGDYAGAKQAHEKALAICEHVVGAEHPHTGTALNNLGLLFLLMGDEPTARRYYERAVAVRRAALGEQNLDTAASLGNLGRAVLSTDGPAAARPLLKAAADGILAAVGDKHPDYATALLGLGYADELAGDAAAAEQAYLRACLVFGRDHPNAALCLDALGSLYLARGDMPKAQTCIEAALASRRKLLGEQHPSTGQSLHQMGQWYYWNANAAESARWLRAALQVGRQNLDLTSTAQSERQQLRMFATLKHRLNDYLSLVLQTPGDAAEAYAHVLVWKGSVFRQQQQASVAARQPELAPLLEKLRTAASRLATMSFQTTAVTQRDPWRQQVAALSEEREKLESQLASASREFRQAREPVTTQRLAQSLPSGTVLVDLVEFAYSPLPAAVAAERPQLTWRLAAFVVARDRPVALLDLGAVDTVTAAVLAWRRDFGQSASAKDAAAALRRQLWEPLHDHLQGAETVLVSADGALNLFPLAALPGSRPDSYLIEEQAVAMLPVPAGLLADAGDDDRKPSAASLLLIGDVDFDAAGEAADPAAAAANASGGLFSFPPLPAAAEEVRQIGELAQRLLSNQEQEVLSKAAATNQAFRQRAARHRFVHVATHGFFAPPGLRSVLSRPEGRGAEPADLGAWELQQPLVGCHPGLLSGLALAGANHAGGLSAEGGAGLLTALEVAALDLHHVELLVLSACETGLGQVASGEGVLGLQRAFQISGVRATVTSLWKVDDQATRELMVRFYTNLWEKKMPKLAALREAQLGMLRGGDASRDTSAADDRRSPRHWAAFVLSGDWR